MWYVKKHLHPFSSHEEVEKWSWVLRIHGLAQELELKRKQCSDLNTERQKSKGFCLRKITSPADISKEPSFSSNIHTGN